MFRSPVNTAHYLVEWLSKGVCFSIIKPKAYAVECRFKRVMFSCVQTPLTYAPSVYNLRDGTSFQRSILFHPKPLSLCCGASFQTYPFSLRSLPAVCKPHLLTRLQSTRYVREFRSKGTPSSIIKPSACAVECRFKHVPSCTAACQLYGHPTYVRLTQSMRYVMECSSKRASFPIIKPKTCAMECRSTRVFGFLVEACQLYAYVRWPPARLWWPVTVIIRETNSIDNIAYISRVLCAWNRSMAVRTQGLPLKGSATGRA